MARAEEVHLEPNNIPEQNIVSVEMRGSYYLGTHADANAILHDCVIGNHRSAARRQNHIDRSTGIISEDVVNDVWRRTIDETDHSRKELGVTGVRQKRVALDPSGRTIPADGGAESSILLGIVAENVLGDCR
jgi:hypothetical protein